MTRDQKIKVLSSLSQGDTGPLSRMKGRDIFTFYYLDEGLYCFQSGKKLTEKEFDKLQQTRREIFLETESDRISNPLDV